MEKAIPLKLDFTGSILVLLSDKSKAGVEGVVLWSQGRPSHHQGALTRTSTLVGDDLLINGLHQFSKASECNVPKYLFPILQSAVRIESFGFELTRQKSHHALPRS